MKIVLIGALGYGSEYRRLIQKFAPQHEICAVVDPHYDGDIKRIEIDEIGTERPDLAIISSPIHYHISQARACIEMGIPTLLEKPICADSGEAAALGAFARTKSIPLGIGFQLSWSDEIQSLKNDIKSGIFGAPLLLKTMLSWQRDRDYFSNSIWKGKLLAPDGTRIYDSVIMNATAHYLHNMFFICDSEPKEYVYQKYRANDIETFDTCIIRGVMTNGATFFYGATHCGEVYREPVFEYRFEKGTVFYDQNKEDMLYAVMNDGSVKRYGALQGDSVTAQKFIKMLGGEVLCTAEDALAHLRICTYITENGDTKVLTDTKTVNNTVIANGILKKIEMDYLEFTV